MTAQAITNPLSSYFGTNGLALTSGFLYIGVADQDPRTSPVLVYFDEAMTIAAAQPLRTTGGYVYRSGAPARVWAPDGTYSIMLRDAADQQVFFLPSCKFNALTSPAFVQAGVGAVSRPELDKLRETVSVTDFGTATQAAAATAGTVVVPNGVTPTLPAAYPGVLFDYLGPSVGINEFQEAGETTRKSGRVFRGYDAGAHTGQEHSLFTVENHAVGSGTNGPTNADYALTVVAQKKNFDTTSTVGEIDAVNIALRQGGAASDGCAILANVATYGTGFMGILEGQTSSIPAGVLTQQVQVQLGVCDNVASAYWGVATIKTTGNGGGAFHARQSASAKWDNFLLFAEGSLNRFLVDSLGQMKMTADTGATPSKTMRVNAGALSVLSDAGAEILNLTDNSVLSVNSVTAGTTRLTQAAFATAAGNINLGSTTAATATAGAGSLPANPQGFLIFFEGATQRKIPYYNT